jgi:gas vesicle protein
MADGYDRFENEGSGGGSFVMGLLTGTVLGAGLGMLFAPKSGSELRSQLSEQAGNLANTASEGYRKAAENASQWAQTGKEAAGEWAERGKDMYGKAKDAVSRGADEAQKYVRDAASSTAGTPASNTGSSSSGSSYGSGSSFGSGSEGMRGAGSSSSPSSSSTGSTTPTGGTRRNS